MATQRQTWSVDTNWKKALAALKVPDPQRDINKPPLLSWKALPEWQRDNSYILSYYRPASYSYNRSFQSLFYLHNESVNIHSHLLGALIFLFTSFSVYVFRAYPVSAADIVAFACFFLGAVVCLTISATYHLISNHSPQIARFGNQLDYVGIVALITGSFVPSVYYGFYCEPVLQKIYWGMASHSLPTLS
jgi:adiponectin receptor